MQRLEVSCAVRRIYRSLGVKGLTTAIRSEKCVVRRFRRCANVIECTYTNLNSTPPPDPKVYTLTSYHSHSSFLCFYILCSTTALCYISCSLLTYLLTYLLITYLLTPYSTALLEKLTGSVASQKIPRIFGTRRFITVLTSARHLSLS